MSTPFRLPALVAALLAACVSYKMIGASFFTILFAVEGLLLGILYAIQVLPVPTTRLSPPARAQPTLSRRYHTYRISNIPISVTKDALEEILVDNGAEENLICFSFALAVASTLATKYRVATVTFVEAPEMSELQKTLRIRLGSQASQLRVDSDFFGLTPLSSPSHDQDITVESVHIHLANDLFWFQ